MRGLKPASPKNASASKQTVDGVVTRRRIDDAPDRDKALKPFRMYARLAVKLVEKVYEWLDEEKLDEEEKEAGIEAFSSLLYEEGAVMNARILCVVWLGTSSIPRAISYVDKKIKAKKEKKILELAENTKPAEKK